ncbi:MAG: T9SS type A sorting domain-containing protein [Candidatus Kapabacteria bacterium]|nr:T9SS type A sorting domain-containing protein [Candidatus Kapabacteria bacterium]
MICWRIDLDNILEVENDNKLVENNNYIFPNPATDYIHLNIETYSSSIQIFNPLGTKVFESEYKDKINVSNLTSGIYFIKAGYRVYKFMKL